MTSKYPSGTQYELIYKDQSLIITQVGGGIRSYSVANNELLDTYSIDEISHNGQGQVLAPWPNRIRGGKYSFGENHYQLGINEVTKNNAIHGLVRWRNWDGIKIDSQTLKMTHLLFPSPGYPFSLHFEITYFLEDSGLKINTKVTNIGSGPAPFGIGAHPYIKLGLGNIDECFLQSPGKIRLITDSNSIPVSEKDLDGDEFDFQQEKEVGNVKLDTCFTHLQRNATGLANVYFSDKDKKNKIKLWMDSSYNFLVLFSGDTLPVNRRRKSLAIEPMSCVPNAFQSNEGLITLIPNNTFEGNWGITLLQY